MQCTLCIYVQYSISYLCVRAMCVTYTHCHPTSRTLSTTQFIYTLHTVYVIYGSLLCLPNLSLYYYNIMTLFIFKTKSQCVQCIVLSSVWYGGLFAFFLPQHYSATNFLISYVYIIYIYMAAIVCTTYIEMYIIIYTYNVKPNIQRLL